MMRNIINIGICISLLTGCGAEIAYKRGASAQDLQTEKNACLKAGDESALEKCMAENGWTMQKLDGSTFSDDELFATASVTEDNRMADSTAKNKKTTQANPETKQSSTTVKPTPKPNLLDNYVIKSWWKMGGSAALLEQNMNTCSEKLGDAHTPDKKTFTYTRGFAICMREVGWRGLIEKK